MIKVLFVCWGNICRSPMAEFVLKHRVKELGIEGDFLIESAATSTEEIGNGVYPPVASKLKAEGIECSGHHARQLKAADYDKYDYIIGMEALNMRYMLRMLNGDADDKLHLLLDYTDRSGDISDPWYTRDFDTCFKEVSQGVDGLLRYLGYL